MTTTLRIMTPADLEAEAYLPGGHIFHGDLSWPFAEDPGDAGRWGVETAHPRVLICGAGARRGAALSRLDEHALNFAAVGFHPRHPGRHIHQQPVAAQLRAALDGQDVVLPVPPGGDRMRPENQLDPLPAQRLAERLAERCGLAGQDPVGALDDDRLAAQAPHDLRET